MIGGASLKRTMLRERSTFFLCRLARVLYPSQQALLKTLPEFRHAYKLSETDPRNLARHRMDLLYAELANIPLEVRHIMGWWIDTHVPVVLSDATSVREMYERGLAPEQNYAFPPHPVSGVLVPVWIPSANQYAPGSSEALSVKLLCKGSAHPPSIRYISSQIERCASVPGESAYTVRSIVLLHVLGMYPGRKRYLGVSERIAMYRKSTVELGQLVVSLGSRELYCIVATFLVWAMRNYAPIWQLCMFEYPSYLKTVFGVLLEYNDRVHVDVSKYSRCQVVYSARALFTAALNVKKKIPVWVQMAIANRAELERCLKIGCLPGRLTVGKLVATGMPIASARKLVVCVSSRAAALAVLQTISRHDRALLYVVMLSKIVSDGLSIRSTNQRVRDAQLEACQKNHGTTTYCATVCVACSTWRPKSRSVRGLSKATCGVIINYADNTVQCNACNSSWSIAVVDMVGIILTARTRLTSQPQQIALCVSCGTVTSPVSYVGVLPYCAACAASTRRLLRQPTTCAVCSVDIKSGTGCVVDSFDSTYEERGVLSLCGRHAHRKTRLCELASKESLNAVASKRETRYKQKYMWPLRSRPGSKHGN